MLREVGNVTDRDWEEHQKMLYMRELEEKLRKATAEADKAEVELSAAKLKAEVEFETLKLVQTGVKDEILKRLNGPLR